MKKIEISTQKKRQIIDITDAVEREIAKHTGLCHLFLLHTTASLATADLDPGTDLDMLDAFEAMIPKLRYRHPHNPAHVPDHILSTLLGTSLTVPVTDGKLLLGTWQRVVLVEFDGPRERKIVISLI